MDELTEDDILFAGEELSKASKEAREAALASQNGFVRFLEALGLRVLAEKIAELIGPMWDALVEIIKEFIKNLDPSNL